MSPLVIGTCSVCGGRVLVPSVWWGVIPPVPTCESCHATARSHGPVIDMLPAPRTSGTLSDLYVDIGPSTNRTGGRR